MKSNKSFPLYCLIASLWCGIEISTAPLVHAGDSSATEVGQAFPVLLAQSYSEKIDPSGFLVSEKLDGVRAIWDGKTLRFRSGRQVRAPAWFTAPFPAHALDGELWMGRETFDQLSAAVRRQEPLDEEWKRISYQLYELPGGNGTFIERVAVLRLDVAKSAAPWLQVVPQEAIADRKSLKRKLNEIVSQGGEGLMLHRADAVWQTGRSDALLKLKPQQDAEAVIIAYEAGRGKYEGMLGALILATQEGRRFKIGTGLSDALRRTPPEIGTTVTYRFRGLTASGLPRFASYWRIRQRE